ncbi:hypothetical protein Gotur_026175 [Gossypium turneri]
MTPDDFEMFSFIVMDPERAGTDEVESNMPAPVERSVPLDVNVSERPVIVSQGGGAREAFFHAMNESFAEFIRTNPTIRSPPIIIFNFPM